MPTIKEGYFVLHGESKSGKNIIEKIIPDSIPSPFVKSGDTFTTDHHKMGYDPFPGKQKDLIIIIEENGVQSELRYSERNTSGRENQNRQIIITIP
ncbi:MAG: hypothetical protein IPI46_12315 [Bacteroidetes bacterium]|nr:hypothetical protein [Bacteroidota bacterium]